MAVLIKKIGSFYIGGRQVTIENKEKQRRQFVKGGPVREVDPNGDFTTGQMYVQYYELENPAYQYPVLFLHGGGVCGACWEALPNGEPGWLQWFLEAGYHCYVSDAVERGRASWSQYPDIYESEPIFRSKNESWTSFRIGMKYDTEPGKRIAFSDTQFPIDYFDEFTKQTIPRWVTNNQAILDAYRSYIAKVGKCIIIAHSQASEFVGSLMKEFEDLIQAVVLLEGSSAPAMENLCIHTPTLHIWGDHIQPGTNWETYQKNMRRYVEEQLKLGAPVTWLELPEMGIHGNSHFLMLDKNSRDIFEIVQTWLKEKIK